ncbi:MAG: hypothetical protein ACK5WZ_05810 [Pseudobdellovibrionaceae bacterium]
MKNRLNLKQNSALIFLSVLSMNTIAKLSTAQAQTVDRPPQYIAISFDGSSCSPASL